MSSSSSGGASGNANAISSDQEVASPLSRQLHCPGKPWPKTKTPNLKQAPQQTPSIIEQRGKKCASLMKSLHL
jgi:hypothetical protein